jgi:ferredoxin-NADP reductase
MREILYWLQDVREYVRVSRRRQALRRPGRGVDYAKEGLQDTARSAVEAIHPKRMQLEVVGIEQATPSSKIFRCRRTDGPLPPFRPGQYVNLFVDVDGVLTSRPYSIASAPGDSLLELAVRDKPGGFVAPYLLHEVQVGDALESTGPAGHFYHEPLIDGDDLVLLAGGSGITPFMSMIQDGVRREQPPRMHLLYGSRVPEDVMYGGALAELAAEHPHFTYTLVISEPPAGYDGPTGFLDAALIRKQVGDVRGKTFYICGPTVMYDFCLGALEELGAEPHRVRRELYGPPADVRREPGWPEDLSPTTLFDVQVEGGDAIRAPAGEPLLNSLERYGVVVPAVCRSGECSACRVRLLAGRVFQPAHTGLRESDREHGYIHACVSYPLEDLHIRL